MCDCIKKVDEALASHNGKLSVGFGLTPENSLVLRLMIGTEKIDKAKRKPVPYVYAAYCPFCGESMSSKAEEKRQRKAAKRRKEQP